MPQYVLGTQLTVNYLNPAVLSELLFSYTPDDMIALIGVLDTVTSAVADFIKSSPGIDA